MGQVKTPNGRPKGSARATARRVALNTRNVPESTKAQFKAYCAKRGYTKEAAIIALMLDCIAADKPLPKARRKEQ